MCRSERVGWQLLVPQLSLALRPPALITLNANRFVRSFNSSAVISHNLQFKIYDFQLLLDRALPQRVIAKDERGHRFYDGHRSRENTRIMASTDGKHGLLV
jgi:hypothetical protein